MFAMTPQQMAMDDIHYNHYSDIATRSQAYEFEDRHKPLDLFGELPDQDFRDRVDSYDTFEDHHQSQFRNMGLFNNQIPSLVDIKDEEQERYNLDQSPEHVQSSSLEVQNPD